MYISDKIRNRPAYFNAVASQALREGALEKAEDVLLSALLEFPEDHRLHHILARTYIQRAENLMQSSVERFYEADELHERAAWHFSRASDLAPSDFNTAFKAGVEYRLLGKIVTAAPYIVRALNVRDDVGAWAELANLTHEIPDTKAEIACWQNVLRIKPTDGRGIGRLKILDADFPVAGSTIDRSILKPTQH